MGKPILEVAKFGLYLAVPISIGYMCSLPSYVESALELYRPEENYRVPTTKDDLASELAKFRADAAGYQPPTLKR